MLECAGYASLKTKKVKVILIRKAKVKLPCLEDCAIETFCGWPVTTEDRCIYCRNNFKKTDEGKIGCYKPWIDGNFWHLKCSKERGKDNQK